MTDYLHDHETPPDGLRFDELVEANGRIGVNPVFGRKLLLAILRGRQIDMAPDMGAASLLQMADSLPAGTYALVRIHNDKEE